MTNQEIIKGLQTHQEWRKCNGGPQLSAQAVTALLDAAITALTPQPAKEHLPEPPVVAEPPKAKAKK